MRKINRNFLLFTLAILTFVSIPIAQVEAVTMSPIRLELAADPGETIRGTVKIYNDEKLQRTLYLSAANFEAKDETGEPSFTPGVQGGLASWVTIQPTVTLNFNEAQEIPFTVSVPSGVDPGGYFAAIFASVEPPAPGDSMIALENNVGTLVLFKVNGQFPEGETILEFETKDKKTTFTNLPIEFYFRFQNSGKDRAMPLGDITIKNLFGGITKVISANRGAGNALPESIRRFDSAWVTAGKGQKETFEGQIVYPQFNTFLDAVKYQWNNFALGRYSADLKLTVNNDTSRSHVKSLAFWIIPWQLLVVIGAVVIVFVLPLALLLGALIVYQRRRRRNLQ